MASLIAIWHTDGRRQPAVLGKDSSGKKLPGGPYTGPQGAAAAIVGLSLFLSRSYWAWMVDDRIVYQWGLIVGLTYAAMKLAARLDYTNLSVLWRVYCGVRASFLGLRVKGPISSATGHELDYSSGKELVSDCQVVAFREVGEGDAADDSSLVPVAVEVQWTAPGGSLIEQLGDRPMAETESQAGRSSRERQFVSLGRRRPQVPVAVAAPVEVLATPSPEPELVTAAPLSALQEFLAAAGRLPGESR